MYACCPEWSADWLSEEEGQKILTQVADKIHPSPLGSQNIGINSGLHFTGGEPFLNFELLFEMVRIATRLKIPSTFVETNCFWCTDNKITREKLSQLKEAGLHGILISVNPFILEQVAFERTERAVRISEEIFGRTVILYQQFFYQQFKRLNITDTLSFDEYLQKTGAGSLRYIELLPMGRAAYKLQHLYKKYPAKYFFGQSCREELTRPWHIHIDNYGNYMTGYCGGISLGDVRGSGLISEVNLDERPILGAVVTDLKKLYEIGKEFGYQERREGYISKCHLCVDIRRHIVQQTDKFKELQPREFYSHLE